jgi:hypothetical protein
MKKFFLGFLTAIVVLILAGVFYARSGMLDPRADIPVNAVEKKIAMPMLDASVDRHAPEAKNPVEPTDEALSDQLRQLPWRHSSAARIVFQRTLPTRASIRRRCSGHAREPEFLHHSAWSAAERNAGVGQDSK